MYLERTQRASKSFITCVDDDPIFYHCAGAYVVTEEDFDKSVWPLLMAHGITDIEAVFTNDATQDLTIVVEDDSTQWDNHCGQCGNCTVKKHRVTGDFHIMCNHYDRRLTKVEDQTSYNGVGNVEFVKQIKADLELTHKVTAGQCESFVLLEDI